MLFREIIAVYSEKRHETNTLYSVGKCAVYNVKV
jgi:hypothetical protein